MWILREIDNENQNGLQCLLQEKDLFLMKYVRRNRRGGGLRRTVSSVVKLCIEPVCLSLLGSNLFVVSLELH